jgi:hypothetical protein
MHGRHLGLEPLVALTVSLTAGGAAGGGRPRPHRAAPPATTTVNAPGPGYAASHRAVDPPPHRRSGETVHPCHEDHPPSCTIGSRSCHTANRDQALIVDHASDL